MKKITENIPKEKICQLLKKVRLDLGYKILGVKAGTYYNYEKDRLPPTELLFLLKEKFPHHVKIDAILDLSDTTELNQKPKCIHSRVSDKENRTGDILANFSDKKMARECIENLVEDVETDDEVIFTCDLPTGVVLIVDDRVEIIIDFESNGSQWVVTGTEFYQKL